MSEARARALLGWYASRSRDIPWRDDPDPYNALVGEVMSQQTQAARAVAHYRRFIARYPDVASLAAAPLADVLDVWAGLGYNSRAKRLRDSARRIVAHGWPDDLEELPGVGPYTAAAVASVALGAQVAVVDTNVRRVLGRWRGRPVADEAPAVAAHQLRSPAADWNQAVMDLGAEICRARNPLCHECPVAEWCAGPGAYEPPRAQTPYEGSRRQARASLLLELARNGAATLERLAGSCGLDPTRASEALDGLVADGLVNAAANGSFTTAD